ncbi:MAG: hypothetical protein [Bacteriophage sp.]|nr:MAG: hypothetical protein [Bacteriophage sp.]DAO12923.1 MAG TPA: hypothetical protein [Caudoviricetes sp.]
MLKAQLSLGYILFVKQLQPPGTKVPFFVHFALNIDAK